MYQSYIYFLFMIAFLFKIFESRMDFYEYTLFFEKRRFNYSLVEEMLCNVKLPNGNPIVLFPCCKCFLDRTNQSASIYWYFAASVKTRACS